jgi:hypothetical protein
MERLKDSSNERWQYEEITDGQISELFKISKELSEPNAQYGRVSTVYFDKNIIEGTVFNEMGVDLVTLDYWQSFGHTENPNPENSLAIPTKVMKTRLLISEFKIKYNSEGIEDDVISRYFLIVDNKRKSKTRKRYAIQAQYARTTEEGFDREDSYDEYMTQREAHDLLQLLKKTR